MNLDRTQLWLSHFNFPLNMFCLEWFQVNVQLLYNNRGLVNKWQVAVIGVTVVNKTHKFTVY